MINIDPLKEIYQELLGKKEQALQDALTYQQQADALARTMVNFALGNPTPCHHCEGERDLYFSELWECSTSPTGYCVYDEKTDPVHDSCLFCKDPEERK